MPAAEQSTLSIPVGPVRIAVVVVTYDAPPQLLEQCVEALLATTDRTTVEVIVVDTGGAAHRRLRDSGDAVTVLDLAVNAGFAAAINAGFEIGLDRGAHVLVSLNDDVLVQPGWLEPLVEALEDGRASHLGAVQPLLVQLGSDPAEINSAGVEIDRYGAGSDRLRAHPVADAKPAALDAVTGGAAAWSAAFVRDVGPADERFFLYYEDVEWCRRGARAGWRFALVPQSRVLHAGSASTHRLGGSLRRLQERNRLWSVAMHGSLRELTAALWLSIRRLRHEPRDVHRHALLDGMRGAPARGFDRVRGRSVAATVRQASGPPDFVRRPVGGVNVLGYHHVSSGLGDNARAIARCLRAAGVDVIEIDNDVTNSPRRRPARPMPTELHDATIAVVTAFEFEGLVARLPELRADGRRLIGYWMWELTTVPDSHVAAMSVLDEVWTASAFVRSAYADVAPGWVPVRRAPYQVPRPVPDPSRTAGWRERWGDRFVFLVTFDYLSIPERKNPEAAIRAFTSAFEPSDGPLLIVKSMNGDRRPEASEAVAAAVGERDDVWLLDDHLDEADHHALIAAADALVSPHRSEGFGLQPFAALAMGTPVVATRYGGVLDYLDDQNSLLVEYTMTGVIEGEGIYPAGAPWADVDHDGLVDAMRRLVDEPALAGRLVTAGRATAAQWPDDRALGLGYLQLLEMAEPRTTHMELP